MRRTDQIALDNLASGRIRVNFRTGVVYGAKGRALKPTIHNGYAAAGLRYEDDDGRYKWIKVYAHRLIWLARYGAIPEGKTVTHMQPPDSDNRLKNLAIGRKRGYRVRLLTDSQVKRIRSYKRLTQQQIARRMGITQARVSHLRKGAA